MATKKPSNVVEMTPTEEKPAPRWVWPENKEKRILEVQLLSQERLAIAEENARLGNEKDQLEDNKKAAASRYKAQIEDVEARIRLNNTYVSTGRRDKEVPCEWLYEVAGFDSSGAPIEHADKKTLVRLDTGEAVEIRDISENERQAALPLEDATEDQPEGNAAPVEVGDDE
jgi:hypothetical protein